MEKARLYRSYLLRLYREPGTSEQGWRVVLEDPVSTARHRFLSLEELVAFLEEEMGAPERAGEDEET